MSSTGTRVRQSSIATRSLGAALLILLLGPSHGWARDIVYTWSYLTPEHDSRDPEVHDFDEFLSKSMVNLMNANETVFQHHLFWQKMSVSSLVSAPAPFCELDFDAVKPLFLTPKEKSILKDYFARGGFIIFSEDTYPYPQDEFWRVKDWPLIDFLTRELPAQDHHFTFVKIDEKHPLFRQYHATKVSDSLRHEAKNPYSPYLTLLSYRGRACAFVDGQYAYLENNKWAAMPRPFDHDIAQGEEGYALTVNLYVYALTH